MAMTTTTTPTTTVATTKRITVGIRVMWAGQGLRASDTDASLALRYVVFHSFFLIIYVLMTIYRYLNHVCHH